MKLVIIVIGTLALVCPSAHASEKVKANDKSIAFSKSLQKCLFGKEFKVDSKREEEALLDYVIGKLHDEEQPSKNPTVNKCLDKEKRKKTKKSIEISGFKESKPTTDARNYEFRFNFYEGPTQSRKAIDFEWTIIPFMTVDRIKGTTENSDSRKYGVDFANIRYKKWGIVEPYLTIGYFNLDEETTDVLSGEPIDGATTDNAKFLFGADFAFSDDLSITITHELGFENGFRHKTVSRTGAMFEVDWGNQ